MDLKAEIAKLKQSRLARNAGWMFLGQGLGLIFQTTYFIVLARLLGSREYGIYAGTFALVSMASQYSTIGSGTVFLRYVSPDKSKFPVYWGNILLITCTVSFLVSAVLYFTARFILNPLSAALIFPAAVSVCFCTQIAVAAGQVFQAFEQLRVTAMMNLLTNIMRAIAAVAMLVLLHHATAWNWVVVSLFVSLAGALIAVITVTVRLGRPKFDFSLMRRHAAEGLQYSFSQSTSSAYNDVDKTMLSHYGMNVQNGIYSMAYRVVEIASIPVFSVRDAATPKFFQQGAKGVTHAAALANSLLKRAMLLGVFSAACIFLFAPIIPHIIGKDYAESVYALRWLSLIPFFRSIHQMTGTALMGAGLQKYRTYTQIVAAAVNFLLNLWLIPRHGWQGAAWSSLLTDAGLGAMNWFMLKYACRKAEQNALASGVLLGEQ
ncbi:O-antigen/teichoic acid export membrane protein [Granulicella aggregans]|uniref:O-antigen/teichoic acid export membrane protein n=1 Tax=Granulicella aggregans TaxID=474949 RepID=A0A7W7ZCP4_9BACT|nr:flippase [Granulicella aggregans]MBB5057149.1 O-antigen/teichoic acid export membrane protein [Granulicella aggregans]